MSAKTKKKSSDTQSKEFDEKWKNPMKKPYLEKIVLNIGVRRSKFKAEDGSIVIVPNLDLSKSKIVNYTYGEGG